MSAHPPEGQYSSGKRTVFVIALISLAGCANFSDDGGFGSVEQTVQERLSKEVKWALGDQERATLQASFFDLGISEADLVQVGRLPNPHFSMLRASKPENGIREYKIE